MKRYDESSDAMHNGPVLLGTDSEWSFIVNALRTAAVTYDKIGGDWPSLCADMERQRNEALRLADRIAEEAGV